MQVDNITVFDIGFEHIVNSTMKEFTMPVLHGAPIEYDVCAEWYAVEDLKPIPSHIDRSQYSDRLEHRCLAAKGNTSH